MEVGESPVRGFDVVAHGLRYHISRAGDGPPLLLLHGFTGSSRTWGSARAHLSDHFTSIAVDLPGHGRTDAPADPARYALDAFADDLAAILDEQGISRTAVLGYSLGGRAALRFALRHPSRIAALVLESASPGIVDGREREMRALADAALAESIEREGIASFVDRWEQLPLWASQASLDPVARMELRTQRLANDPRGLANSLRGAGAGVDPPVLERLTAITVPTLVVCGLLDRKYRELGKSIAAAVRAPVLPSWPARLMAIPEAGHNVHLEQPRTFGQVVRDFLDAVVRDLGSW